MRSKKVGLIVLAFLFALCASACSDATTPNGKNTQESQGEAESQEVKETTLFEGENVTVTYRNVSEATGVSGAFLLNLQMENPGDASSVYYLQNVYVDGLACQTGTGLPVTAEPGKRANGSFIVFYSGNISDIGTIEFQLVAADKETYNTIETTNTITITP